MRDSLRKLPLIAIRSAPNILFFVTKFRMRAFVPIRMEYRYLATFAPAISMFYWYYLHLNFLAMLQLLHSISCHETLEREKQKHASVLKR